MTDVQKRRDPGRRSTMMVLGFTSLLTVPAAPTTVNASAFGTAPGSEIQINCPAAVMKQAATFSTNPKGSAAYPFEMQCANKNGPGVLYLYFEGRWNPSETRQDMPNAVETLFIENYARNFITGRQQRGAGGDNRIFVYWTARCTADPWLQGGSCRRYGEYVPDDVRAAMPDLGLRPFPLTGNSMSPSLKQQLIKQYQAANTPVSTKQITENMTLQSQQLQSITQAQRDRAMTAQPQMALPKPSPGVSALSRAGIFARGVESQEGQPETPQQQEAQPEAKETSAPAILEDKTPEIAEPVVVTLDRPLHVVTATGEAVMLTPGTYEIRPVLDVQLGLAREGHPTVLLHAHRGAHNESIPRTIAMAVPGEVDQVHIVLLTSDGRRFDAQGSGLGVMSRGTGTEATLADKPLDDALKAASARPPSHSPPCLPNPAEVGPRWLPVPCTMPATDSGVAR